MSALYDPQSAYASFSFTYDDAKRSEESVTKIDGFKEADQAYWAYCYYYGYNPYDQQVQSFWQGITLSVASFQAFDFDKIIPASCSYHSRSKLFNCF